MFKTQNYNINLACRVEKIILNGKNLLNFYILKNKMFSIVTSVIVSFTLDKRNDFIFPTSGYFFKVTGAFISPFSSVKAVKIKKKNNSVFLLHLLKNFGFKCNQFLKYEFCIKSYYSFYNLWFIEYVVFRYNIVLGYINNFDNIFIFENYKLGGFNTIRGYKRNSISSKLEIPFQFFNKKYKTFIVGDNKQFFGNVEIEVPLFLQLGINGLLFLDFGNIFNKSENFFKLGYSVQNFRVPVCTSIGFGLRCYNSLGLFRFEWVVPLAKRPLKHMSLKNIDKSIDFKFSIIRNF